ncbi:Rieske 2Fe-2S domain-containing protein [Streptomyces sp. NPDC057280]|uniref:Rieske 2Fe-2S domain-containing protein n=1 Tax=Streptomyces sp. NPDC057280 TaxID=3346081 RepID=UPI0036455FF8
MTTAPPRPALPQDCTFDAGDWSILAQHRYPVALSSQIGDAPTAVRLLEETLVAYRVGGSVVVPNGICPHRGVPLSLGGGDPARACLPNSRSPNRTRPPASSGPTAS